MCFLDFCVLAACISMISSTALDSRSKLDIRLANERFNLPSVDKNGPISSSRHHHVRRPLVRTNVDPLEHAAVTSPTLLATLLVFNVIAITMISFLLFQGKASSVPKFIKSKNRRLIDTSLLEPTAGPGQMTMTGYPDVVGSDSGSISRNVARHLQCHLKQEFPLHANKETKQRTLSENELPAFINRYFETDADSESELKQVLANRRDGSVIADNWWSWEHRDPLTIPVGELMSHLHCDGLLDWSMLPASALADTYMQLIVTSGVGSKAMLHEGADADWLLSLHQDVFHDFSARGLRYFFVTKVDTLLVGCIGRKKIVMLPPHAVTPSLMECTFGRANFWCCGSNEMHDIRNAPRERGWQELERHALEVGGVIFTICPNTYCYVPAGWWHIVRPLDDFTAVLSPSFIRGCWAQITFDEQSRS